MAWNPTFKINLLNILDDSYNDENLKDKLRDFVATTEFKQLFGQRVVDKIVDRTREQNIDKNGKSLGTYSTHYRESLFFEIYHGSERRVNLTATGEMLESLNPKLGKYVITIQLEGEENRGKAQGHISGKYGKFGRTDPRDFLGLPEKMLQAMFKESMRDYRADALTEIAV